MNQRSISQLDKVLALADSSHEGEAVVAVRKARQMLSRDGLSFGDLARAATKKSAIHLPFGFLSSTQNVHLEIELIQARQKLSDLEATLNAQTAQTDKWRQKSLELEQKLTSSQTEAERWRQLARDTVEKLWDLGQTLQKDESLSDSLSSPSTDETKTA